MVFQEIVFCQGISLNTLSCSHISQTSEQGYFPEINLIHNFIERSVDEHNCPLQVQLHWSMQLISPQKSDILVAHLCVAFVEIFPMPSAIAHISHIQISLQCKTPYHVRASHSMHSKLLYTPHLTYMSMKQDIWLATTLNGLFINTTPPFKGRDTGTGIQDPYESDRVGLYMFLLHSSWK